MFFLGTRCRLISFLAAHEALLAGLSVGVYFYTGVAAGVIGRTYCTGAASGSSGP